MKEERHRASGSFPMLERWEVLPFIVIPIDAIMGCLHSKALLDIISSLYSIFCQMVSFNR